MFSVRYLSELLLLLPRLSVFHSLSCLRSVRCHLLIVIHLTLFLSFFVCFHQSLRFPSSAFRLLLIVIRSIVSRGRNFASLLVFSVICLVICSLLSASSSDHYYLFSLLSLYCYLFCYLLIRIHSLLSVLNGYSHFSVCSLLPRQSSTYCYVASLIPYCYLFFLSFNSYLFFIIYLCNYSHLLSHLDCLIIVTCFLLLMMSPVLALIVTCFYHFYFVYTCRYLSIYAVILIFYVICSLLSFQWSLTLICAITCLDFHCSLFSRLLN